MAQVGNNDNVLGGPYMVQDRDHMSDSGQTAAKAKRGTAAQAEQSNTKVRQQGAGDHSTRQQGDSRRQSH